MDKSLNIAVNEDLDILKKLLMKLRAEGKIVIAILYGSYAKGVPHKRSDIDLALYIKAKDEREEMEIIDSIFMAIDREISILRLDDEDESPFVIQEALKGVHLVDADKEILYSVSHRVLHDSENIRFRKELSLG
jgi:predicted nucleotidyltransferase